VTTACNAQKLTMKTELTVEQSVTINASKEKIFDALINPEKIKQYMFGTEAKSDWKTGSPISFNGEYQGHKYQDKGIVMTNEPSKLFQYKYWSSMSGMEDEISNYATVTFTIDAVNDENKLTVKQVGFSGEIAKEHSVTGWTMILNHIKEILEKE
jgi:uncharacterized protein YndB with AHSA1/START domain